MARLVSLTKILLIVVIAVQSVAQYFFVLKGMQSRQKGQFNVDLTLSPCLNVKPLRTAKTAIPNNSTK